MTRVTRSSRRWLSVLCRTALIGGIALWAGAAMAQTTAAADPFPATQPAFDGMHVMTGIPDYVPTRLGRLHYWSLGTGPAIILLHQAPLFGIEFAKIQPLLAAQGFRTIAVDIPGFGLSQRPDHSATGAEYADALAALLDHLGIAQAAVAGSHTGATIALAFATHQPARVACLALQSVPVYSPEELDDRLAKPAADTTIYRDGRQVTALWQSISGAYDFSHASPESMEWLVIGSLLSGDVSSWYGPTTGRTFVSRAFDSARAIPRVKVPTLMLSVSGDHLEASVQRALTLRPDFQSYHFAAPHAIVTIDRPRLWADTVGGFFKSRCPNTPAAKH